MMNANGNGRLAAATSALAQHDKITYATIGILMAILSFLAVNLYNRMGSMELLLREVVTSNKTASERFIEDHTLLMSIEASRQQRTTSMRRLEERIDRLELSLFHVPAVKGTDR